MRNAFNGSKHQIELTRCEVCGRKSEIRHHIIPLLNNGSNSPKNIIQLCNNCHCSIHLWMPVETPKEIIEMDMQFKSMFN